jgi:hypothetical protein
MFIHSTLRGLRMLALTVIAGVAISAPAPSDAAPHFSGGGGYHGAVGVHGGYGGYRGYGYRGGNHYGYGYGWRGGYGFRGGCCWWGWPGAFWLGALPLYYSTWWWGGVPYYYAYDNYYIWNGPAGQYQLVTPPEGLVSGGAPAPGAQAPGSSELFAYPKNGQSAEQQARDRQECRAWAATQTASGNSGATGAIASAAPQSSDVGMRAEAACLEGRGYSVK